MDGRVYAPPQKAASQGMRPFFVSGRSDLNFFDAVSLLAHSSRQQGHVQGTVPAWRFTWL